VGDNINGANEIVDYVTDLKDQHTTLFTNYSTTYDENDESTHNYVYDNIGQLIKDRTEGFDISWRGLDYSLGTIITILKHNN